LLLWIMSLLFVYETSRQPLEGINKKCMCSDDGARCGWANCFRRQIVEKRILARKTDFRTSSVFQ